MGNLITIINDIMWKTWIIVSSLLVNCRDVEVLCMLYLYHRLMLCLTYAQAQGPQALHIIRSPAYTYISGRHERLWYKDYVSYCLYRLIARKYELEHWISLLGNLRKFDYGPVHASSNRVIPTFVNKNGWILWKSQKVLLSN